MEIKIIETSDMHGYVLPTNYTERNMDLGFSTAKAATVIRRLKEENEFLEEASAFFAASRRKSAKNRD